MGKCSKDSSGMNKSSQILYSMTAGFDTIDLLDNKIHYILSSERMNYFNFENFAMLLISLSLS
jgi:hypothetical protein